MKMLLLLIVFGTILQVLSVQVASYDEKNFTCAIGSTSNSKHHWEIEQFLGLWNGVKLYSHREDESNFNDTCLRLKISEVNDLNDEINLTKPTDLYDHLSLRHLRLRFSFQSHSLVHVATVNMSNIDIWKSKAMSVQVIKSDHSLLTLTICEPQSSKLYTILLRKGDDEEKLKNDIYVHEMIMDLKKIKVISTASLQQNCTEEIGAESAGKNVHVSFVFLMFLLFANFLMP